MQKILLIGLLAAVGCATAPKVEPQDNPFGDYGKATEDSKEAPLTVYWQDAHRREIDEATAKEALIAAMKTPEAAEKLLAEIKPAYQTEPVTAMKIAAVSQLSMCRKLPEAPKYRAILTEALLKRAATAEDVYVKLFCLDQLRWCGHPDEAAEVRKLGKKSGDRSVADFAALVARELEKAKK